VGLLILSMHFWKYSALGNTFVVVEIHRAVRARVLPWVRTLCDPETGVAADGVALVEPSRLRLHIYNADGGRAEVSGNGARCAAQRLFDAGGYGQEILLQADAGPLRCLRTRRGISVTLPPPRFATRQIPARAGSPEVWGLRLRLPKPVNSDLTVYALSVGNPQCVVWGSQWLKNWEAAGALLHAHRMFPERTNVVFARSAGRKIEVKLWERGVGPTLSSGTGAAAAAVVGARLGKTPRHVDVKMAGGTMHVVWRPDQQIELVAPAELIAAGTWNPRRTR